MANSGEPPEPSLRTRYIKPLSVTWVPSPDAYSSRNAVSLAFAAVFLTAANALGSSNATRASFIVRCETCAMAEAGHHAAAARRARDRRRLESASCSQAAKARIFIAKFVQQQARYNSRRRVFALLGAIDVFSSCLARIKPSATRRELAVRH